MNPRIFVVMFVVVIVVVVVALIAARRRRHRRQQSSKTMSTHAQLPVDLDLDQSRSPGRSLNATNSLFADT